MARHQHPQALTSSRSALHRSHQETTQAPLQLASSLTLRRFPGFSQAPALHCRHDGRPAAPGRTPSDRHGRAEDRRDRVLEAGNRFYITGFNPVTDLHPVHPAIAILTLDHGGRIYARVVALPLTPPLRLHAHVP